MKITAVTENSVLAGQVEPGDSLVSVNGKKVADNIDYHFCVADESLTLRFEDKSGRRFTVDIDEASAAELGLTFEDDPVRICGNQCIFCFVHQQPKGMRRSLYIKDEDYRLSFTHGNFVTLANMSDADINRIIRQRLSPLYISVHATDEPLRRRLLGNDMIKPIMPLLKRLVDNGIALHTQVVLCPGINDGDHLRQTIDDLVSLHPSVQTLGVVPVGLTRYRERLPQLRTYERGEAREMVDYIESRQTEFAQSLGTRFVWPADEFYIQAERPFPSLSSYEEMEQFENGIGMMREFLTGFNRRRQYLKRVRVRKRILMLTGRSAFPFLQSEIMPFLSELKMPIRFEPVTNRFWGESVTVSGLLTGQDLLRSAKQASGEADIVMLPPNCLNNDDLFLDNMSLNQFQRALGKPVLAGSYNLYEAIKEAAA